MKYNEAFLVVAPLEKGYRVGELLETYIYYAAGGEKNHYPKLRSLSYATFYHSRADARKALKDAKEGNPPPGRSGHIPWRLATVDFNTLSLKLYRDHDAPQRKLAEKAEENVRRRREQEYA